MSIEQKTSPLVIAFLGYTNALSQKGLKHLAEDNFEQVDNLKMKQKGSILKLKDGTVIVAVDYYLMDLVGSRDRFDQLILCDDERWNITYYKADIISHIIKENMCFSCVPEEYRILKYQGF